MCATCICVVYGMQFYVQTSIALQALVQYNSGETGGSGLPPAPVIDAATRSAAKTFVTEPKPSSSGR